VDSVKLNILKALFKFVQTSRVSVDERKLYVAFPRSRWDKLKVKTKVMTHRRQSFAFLVQS
jgi:hypothetical protein